MYETSCSCSPRRAKIPLVVVRASSTTRSCPVFRRYGMCPSPSSFSGAGMNNTLPSSCSAGGLRLPTAVDYTIQSPWEFSAYLTAPSFTAIPFLIFSAHTQSRNRPHPPELITPLHPPASTSALAPAHSLRSSKRASGPLRYKTRILCRPQDTRQHLGPPPRPVGVYFHRSSTRAFETILFLNTTNADATCGEV